MTLKGRAGLVALLLVATAGCSGGDTTAATRTAAVDEMSPAPTSSGTSEGSGPLTLGFAGDVHFTDRTKGYPENPAPLIAALKPLAAADLSFVNLETAITDRGSPEPKSFHFRTSPAALDALKSAGVDAVTMANNHAVDYGPVGLDDTLKAIDASPIPVVGVGADEAAAYRPAILTAKGRKVALLGATQVPDRTLAAWSADANSPGVASAARRDRLVTAVTEARSQADVVVVFLHWGTDYTSCPNSLQKSLADRLVAAGADVVVGTHAHRVQGSGWDNSAKAYIAWGLGNFVWWRSTNVGANDTGVLTLTLDGRKTTAATWNPMQVGNDGLPQQLTGSDRDEEMAVYADAVKCSGLSATG